MKPIILAEEPGIAVTLEWENGKLLRTVLSLSEQFEYLTTGKEDPALAKVLLDFLKGYVKGSPKAVSLPFPKLTPFRKKVLEKMHQVPFGETMTYGELAAAAGNGKAARAAGTVCHDNPFPLFIPCHRIVGSGGRLCGFAYGIEMKKRLIDFEKSRV